MCSLVLNKLSLSSNGFIFLDYFSGRRKNRELLQQKNKRGIPDLKDHSAVQQYFLQEIQLGETLLAAGDLDNGVEHLANALTVCGQPNQLLGVLQQTLPPNVFNALIEKLPPAGIVSLLLLYYSFFPSFLNVDDHKAHILQLS